jgi:hypothetical protein
VGSGLAVGSGDGSGVAEGAGSGVAEGDGSGVAEGSADGDGSGGSLGSAASVVATGANNVVTRSTTWKSARKARNRADRRDRVNIDIDPSTALRACRTSAGSIQVSLAGWSAKQ